MAIIRFDPIFSRLMRPGFWDEEEKWPQFQMNEGLDVYEANNKVVVKASVPGVPSDKIDVTYEEGVLTIKGASQEREEEKDKNKIVYKKERISSFSYTTVLPRPISEKSISAEVADGVVTITADIAQEAKAKKISVRSSKK